MKKLVVLLGFTALQMSCTSIGVSRFDAIIQKHCGDTQQCFEKVQAAIDAAPQENLDPYRIYIAPGVYTEKITLAKNNVHLLGAGQRKTRFTYGDYAGKLDSEGKNLGTPRTYTLLVRANDIRIENLTIENSFDFLANDALAGDDPKKLSGTQAVALFIDSPSDKVLVRKVSLLGYQDTLFVNSGRSWFDKVLIAGNVDYIFGNGNALFTQSEIKTLGRGKATQPNGFVTAPSTQIANDFGLTFMDCRLTRDKSVPDNSTPLGRPWHPTTTFADGRYADPNAVGKSVFINTWMDAHITQDGWYSMGGTAKDGTKKSFLPEDARFFEFNSRGPGAHKNTKRRELDAEIAKTYTQQHILGDWKK
ncbi:MAG TPA: pectinesterase family protein [Cellvibrio sp.]|nr:pectinesterase family protein [Cellvibrio sp.]